MTLTKSADEYGYCLAAKNVAVILYRTQSTSSVLRLIDVVVKPDNQSLFAQRRDLSSIFILKLHILMREHRQKDRPTGGGNTFLAHG